MLGKPNFECHKMIQNNPILRGIQLLTTKKKTQLSLINTASYLHVTLAELC